MFKLAQLILFSVTLIVYIAQVGIRFQAQIHVLMNVDLDSMKMMTLNSVLIVMLIARNVMVPMLKTAPNVRPLAHRIIST